MNYFKVHARNDYKWAHPIHECLQFLGKRPEKMVFIPGMVLNHYPDATKSRGSYLPLLEMAVQENPDNEQDDLLSWQGIYVCRTVGKMHPDLKAALGVAVRMVERGTLRVHAMDRGFL